MRVHEYVEVLRRDGQRLAEAARRAGLDAVVPTFPGWLIRDLVTHVGGVQRWAARHVATQRGEPFTAEEEKQFFTPPIDSSLLAWFRAGHQALVDALAGAEPTVRCWTFLPAPSPLAFWARRQAHETAIHRADADSAISTVPGWAPQFATDGIDELLNGFFGRRPDRITADPPVSIALSATDADVAWTIQMERRRSGWTATRGRGGGPAPHPSPGCSPSGSPVRSDASGGPAAASGPGWRGRDHHVAGEPAVRSPSRR